MWLTRLSIKNPYFATVLMLALLLIGLIAAKRIAIERFPDVKYPVAVISTTYKGASPEVIEAEVTKPLEEAVNTINGLKELRSYSREGISTVVAEFDLSIDPELAIQNVRDKVATVTAGFRKGIDISTIGRWDTQDAPVFSLAFSSNEIPLREITTWVNQVVKKRLQTIPGVGEVKVVGGIDRQVRINLEPYKLQSLGLSVTDVLNAINNANNNYPAGYVKTEKSNINVRLNGKLQNATDFANIVITNRNNIAIKVSDIATVIDGEDEYNSFSLINGKPSVGIDVRQVAKTNLVDMIDGINSVLAELKKTKPAAIDITVTFDSSEMIKRSLNNVEKNLLEGALLTIFIVFVFLKSWRSTVITGLTLPIALIGTIFAIYLCGFTLNMMTLLALSLCVGLLIDDAIVVRENIVRHLKMGKDHFHAALEGTDEIGIAVLATTMTIVAVFLPVGLMHGYIGKWFLQFGITVTVAVLISLLVSFTLDPMLSSIWREPHDGGWLAKSPFGKLLDKFERQFERLITFYEKFICLSLNYKKTTLILAFSILIGSFFLVPLIGAEFVPQEDEGQYSISFKTPTGSNVDYTASKIIQIQELLKPKIPEIKMISAAVAKSSHEGSNNGSLDIDVGNKNTRKRNIEQIMQQTRKLLANIAGIELQGVNSMSGNNGGGKPIRIHIIGDSTDVIKKISGDLMSQIRSIKGVTDLENTYQQADPSLNIDVNRDLASSLGIRLSDVGNTLATLFNGNRVTTWEDPKTGQDYDVVVQIPDDERDYHILDLLKVPSINKDANQLPEMVSLSTIAKTKNGFSPRVIEHINLKRKVTIMANIIGSNNQAVFSQIQKIINKYNIPPGYNIRQGGDSEDMQDSFSNAVSALLVGVAFIYMILTAQFRSFIQPIVIMVALPLSFVGVFIALFLSGSTLNLFSIIGIIMLMGLATKNGILLVDFINKQISEGVPMVEAIINSGKIRLRPIIMTSTAMIFGMLPVALASGEGSETKKPMAYAIIGGMTTSTILTLIVVPVIYVYLSRLDSYIKRKLLT